MKRLLKSRKALSPVVAAIILIAVTVAVSIAVAAWMGALTFTFMQTEEMSFTNYEWGASNAYCQIQVKNTGSSALSISEVRVNDVIAADDGIDTSTPYQLAPGDTVNLNITRTGGYTSGVKYEFKVITAKGNTFGPYIRTAP
ncbi:MAG TPA: archaellin/type IV pilin N-terminal domain-containing protein [Candidatus Paceibacterota bacterium]|nr:archaellin/type IV pilin N-terminal domain-containing protein [Candidatus Paceibacterota bacterium]